MALTVPSGQAQLAVRSSGSRDGLPLLFLHAGVADQRAWAAQVQHFQTAHPVVTFDQRGYGETTSTPEPYSPAEDVLAVMNATGLEQAVLVGNSKGGRLALDFTLADPERVRALVLIGTAISGSPRLTQWPPEVLRLDEQMDAALEAGDLDSLNELEAQLWLDGPGRSAGRVSGPLRELLLEMNGKALKAENPGDETEPEPAYPRLNDIKVPTLLVVGDLDLPSIHENSEYAARSIPDASLHVMPGTAHLPQLEQPESFNAVLEAWLKALP
ncbi:alpha/beta fold hydrolase [Deinococcus fonticola]|uniref:alpha/beta fold hydrolase n=1 Tax=Deinococcus fonticola TaxID=2528713 RepID=UPI0010755B8A|nr:alpha/beta hydrolase [Deinococcus fonticola]